MDKQDEARQPEKARGDDAGATTADRECASEDLEKVTGGARPQVKPVLDNTGRRHPA